MKSDILLFLKSKTAKDMAESVLTDAGKKFYYQDLSGNIFSQINKIQPIMTIIEVDNKNLIQKINAEIISINSLPFYPLILLIHEQLTIPLSIIDANDTGHITIVRSPKHLNELYNRINIYLSFATGAKPVKKKKFITRNSIKTVFNTFFENLNEMVFIAEEHGCKIIYANKKFKDVVGYDPEDKSCWEVLANKNKGLCEDCDFEQKNIEKQAHNRIVFYKNISRWYSIDEFLSPWLNKKTVRIHIGTDITSLKKTQNQLKEAKKKAEKATLLKDRFISLVAHDLKLPFASIMADLELLELKKNNISDNEFYDMHERVLSNGNRAIKLINILLNINRLKTGSIRLEYKIIDGAKIINTIVKELLKIAEKKSIIIKNQIPDQFWMFADASLFGEVIYNIINNAIKFSYSDSKIEIKCPDLSRPEIVIQDFGVGMTQETLKNLFSSETLISQPGTADEKGTGLGINYCKDIMKAHKGEIFVVSEADKGTSVSLKFPCVTPKVIIISDEELNQIQYEVLDEYNIDFIDINSKKMKTLQNYHDDDTVCMIIYNLEDYEKSQLQKLARFKKPVFLLQQNSDTCSVSTKDYPELMCIAASTLNAAVKNILIWNS
ncbi:MAG: PAS domain-containing sensor histidine kinase [Deltaproteobacteria bacterium]|nr:PAS domain-containing sensor histidine kinase [Deltaproteobacteria bacterium]